MRSSVCLGLVLTISGITFGQLGSPKSTPLPDNVEFNRDIRPLLSDNCFQCHGPDKNKRKADLRLDTDVGLHGQVDKAGVVIPGKPAESELFRRIISTDAELKMPPTESGKSLTAYDIELIRKWILQGGRYEGHWAFLPIRKDVTNDINTDQAATQKIDDIVANSLAEQKIKVAPEADRITLLRRLSFDLTGLPPTDHDVAEFLKDSSTGWYAKAVERLLASPHFGERLAIWWLDLVRYADTVGYHGDQEMSVSPFRQYVIDSFNANKRFDQFTTEQLAGDLMHNPTREQLIASGYNRLGMMSAEGGVQDKEYLAKYIAERVRNASGTWLGVTLGCAECHDHKFDPFTTRDFYRFESFFADISERGLYSGANDDGNWGPSIKVPSPQQETEIAALNALMEKTKAILETSTPDLVSAQTEWEKSLPEWIVLNPDSITSAEGATLSVLPDHSILASGNSPATDTYTFMTRTLPKGVTAIRLEVLPDDALPQKGPGRAGNGNFVLSELVITVKRSNGDIRPIALQNATATYEQTGAAGANPYKKWAVEAAIDGDSKGKTWGWAVMEKVGQPHSAFFEIREDLTLDEGASVTIALQQNLDNPQHTIGRFRLSATTSPRPIRTFAPEIAAILAVAPSDRTEAQSKLLATHFRAITPRLESARSELAALEKSRKDLEASMTSTLITASVTPRMVRILRRGNWMDESGDVVTPAFPAVFSPPPDDKRLTRLDLAKWIVGADNPLTSRTFVNRIWKIYFGAGLSRRLDDLGAQGDWPSHPMLIDYLAARFVRTDWDVKRLIKTIVMTRTYRQSSFTTPELRESDPYNRWLARQGRFRLDAEFVRDNALSISGLLVTKIGGKSVRPYQPPGYWAYLNFPQREWQNGSGDELYRRGLYTHWQRQYLHPSLLAFDAPAREECTADRPRSNTPLQSLVLLNDPTYIEAARAFAELILRQPGSDHDKLDFAFHRALSRPIESNEADVLEQLLKTHLVDYEADSAAAQELLTIGARPLPNDLNEKTLAAWTSVARAILNLHEVVTRY